MPLIIDKEGRKLWIDGPQGYNALHEKQKKLLDVKPPRMNGLTKEIEECRRTSSPYHHNILKQKRRT
jgi:hypothetical protein|tara:strand:- start:332 stop:532 length:201 start_codon:yes stop_codon:yes gene_type:complete